MLNMMQHTEKDSKYQFLNKFSKDYQGLAQVKTGNTSENLLNEIRQIMQSLYHIKEITEEVYNNIMNSVKVLILYS